MSLLNQLNSSQRQAVEAVKGRVLVLAGAGSGKTKVLTVRMAYLIQQYGVSPRSILGLTFTNKAAAEMRHRIAQLVGVEAAKQITLSTFHSFCMQILRAEIGRLGYTQQFTLWDEKDLHRMISTIARDHLELEGELPSLAPTVEAIAMAKNRGLAASEISNTGSEWHDRFVQTVYTRLKESMRAYNAVDFDDLLTLTVDLFEKFPDILEKYQERYRYLMIDEYQDTNPIQYRLASLLAGKYQNLCVVGDDDQSIYGWRGAEVKNILEFSDATVIKLEQNYRSTNTILKAANAVIGRNTMRYEKALWSQKGEGSAIEVFHAPNEADEAQAVICRLDQLRIQHGVKWGEMAILYRSNALSRNYEMALLKHTWRSEDGTWIRGIPYQIHGGVEFYERREVKDLMAYLRVLVNPLDQEALLRIINYPRRGIGESALDILTAYNRSQNIPLMQVLRGVTGEEHVFAELREKIAPKTLNSLKNFLEILKNSESAFKQLPLEEALMGLIDKIGFQKALEEEVKSEQMRSFKWENVQEFISSLAEYRQKAEQPTLHEFLLANALQSNYDNSAAHEVAGNKVTLMTLHSAKGLEFPACFLVGMEDHIIPHEKSMKQTGVEEERRLMYVAITRAMRFLTISMAQQRKRMGVDSPSHPSRFLFEIPKELMKITKWNELSGIQSMQGV